MLFPLNFFPLMASLLLVDIKRYVLDIFVRIFWNIVASFFSIYLEVLWQLCTKKFIVPSTITEMPCSNYHYVVMAMHASMAKLFSISIYVNILKSTNSIVLGLAGIWFG